MAVIALDTHAVVKELQAAGFTEPQAEALTRAVRKAQDVDLSTLATKADLNVVKTDLNVLKTDLDVVKTDLNVLKTDLHVVKTDLNVLKADLQILRSELDKFRLETKTDIDSLRQSTRADIDGLRLSTRADMAELKADLLKWTMGAIGLQTIATTGTGAALIRLLPR